MERPAPLRTLIAAPSDALPGGDAGRDSALHYAAVGIFSLVGLGVLGVCLAVWMSRDDALLSAAQLPLFLEGSSFAGGDSVMGGPAEAVAADAPVLRPSLGATGTGSITLFDGATGESQVLRLPAELDTAEATGAAPVPGRFVR